MIDLHLSAFAPRWRFLYAVRIDAYPFSILLIKTWVYVVDVFLVQAVLGEAQAFTEAYKMEITSL